MTRIRLLLSNLRYFRGVNLAVVAGMAVATAVLAGALMVGDSVRGSLADLARRRLGPVDDALVAGRFFDQSLAERLGAAGQSTPSEWVTPAILIRGGANDERSSLRTADVQIGAIAQTPGGQPPLLPTEGFPPARGSCIINGELADAVGAQMGDSILLSVPTQSDLPRESALSRRSRSETLASLRVTVSRIERQADFISLFNPNGSQRVPRNAWVNLQDLQDLIDQPERANVLFVHHRANDDSTAASAALNERLQNVIRLADYGITITSAGDNEASVFARETYLAPPVVDAARRSAQSLHIPLRPVSVNLLNTVKRLGPGAARQIHYAVAAGISDLAQGPLADHEIAINQWTADQLSAKPGDSLAIDFFVRQPDGDLAGAAGTLPPAQLAFTLKYILPMEGLGADPKLPPNYKGLTDAQSVADWNPPEGLPIDKSLVTKADEEYWRAYRAAPKVFLNLETARKLWGGTYGGVTGLRVPAEQADRFARDLLRQLKPPAMGLSFHPIRAEQLAAARGGTDFAMFFLMFSFFLIVAAGLLVAMLFRLNVEQRARQLGLLGALGFSAGQLRRLMLGEGLLLASLGGIVGLLGAVGYTWLIMAGLRTWWVGAVGTTAMRLYVEPLTLAYGFAASLLVAFAAILWAVWSVGKTPSARLLAGAWGSPTIARRSGRITRWIGMALGGLGLATVGLAVAGRISAEEGFGGGALLLVGALCWLGGVLRPRRFALIARRSGGDSAPLAARGAQRAAFVGRGSILRLGIRNATRHTARGVLSAGLVGFAAFTLITVAAMRQTGVSDPDKQNSETGGYRLILTADIPLLGDLNTAAGRRTLGIREPSSPLFRGARFTPLRQWAGQDISCLNLTRPSSPTILGVPPEMIRRGGFIQGSSLQKTSNVWTLLDGGASDAIPVIADADTQEYVLQIPLGGELTITDPFGTPRKLKLVATIAHSIFQGQLLMSDANFRKLFPAQSGFGTVLVELPAGAPASTALELQRFLASELDEYAVSVDTTLDRLKAYQNVQNTYLSTFQTLGGLGLMLGTLGLSVVLVRTVIERKSELSLLASLGFTSASRVALVLAENAFLLVLGLGMGAACAVIGVIPAVLSSARSINAAGLALTLLLVLAIGLVASMIAVRVSGLHVTPADLRRE